MKILFISNLYPPFFVGGYERTCQDVAEALRAKGHEITILTSDFKAGGWVEPTSGIFRTLKLHVRNEANIYEHSAYSGAELGRLNEHNIRAFDEAVRRANPDLVFAWNLYFFGQPFMGHIDRVPRPLVYFVSDNWVEQFFPGPYRDLKGRLAAQIKNERLRRIALWGARRFGVRNRLKGAAIFSSRFMVRLHKDAGVTFSDSTRVYNGVDLSRFLEKKRTRYEIESVANLLFAGRIVDVKGVHLLLEAMKILVHGKGLRSIKIDLYGDQSHWRYVEKIKTLIEEFKLQEFVRMTPPVPQDELADLFRKYDIYVFPSLHEPFSITLIQAIAAGTPVVASDAGGNLEIVRDGKNGLAYSKGDARALAGCLSKMLSDVNLRRRLGEQGACDAARFSLPAMTGPIEAYLKKIVSQKTGAKS